MKQMWINYPILALTCVAAGCLPTAEDGDKGTTVPVGANMAAKATGTGGSAAQNSGAAMAGKMAVTSGGSMAPGGAAAPVSATPEPGGMDAPVRAGMPAASSGGSAAGGVPVGGPASAGMMAAAGGVPGQMMNMMDDGQDTDNDGYTDAEERHAGTDPMDPESVIYKGGWPYNMNKDAIADPGWDNPPANGSIMPRYRAVDQYGDMVDLYDLAGRGKKIVIDVGTWFCKPCKGMAQYFATGDPMAMDDYAWWQPAYLPVLDMINQEEIYWVTVLFSRGQPVTQDDATRWHDAFPNDKIIVLADTENKLEEFLQVVAMPHVDVLDENMVFEVYEVRGPTTGMRHIVGLE